MSLSESPHSEWRDALTPPSSLPLGGCFLELNMSWVLPEVTFSWMWGRQQWVIGWGTQRCKRGHCLRESKVSLTTSGPPAGGDRPWALGSRPSLLAWIHSFISLLILFSSVYSSSHSSLSSCCIRHRADSWQQDSESDQNPFLISSLGGKTKVSHMDTPVNG